MTAAVPNPPQILAPNDLDYLLLVHSIHEKLLDILDYAHIDDLQEDKEALDLYVSEEITKIVDRMDISKEADFQKQVIQSVTDEVLGFGPIQSLFRDETITDIFVNSPTTIFVERRGRIEKLNIRFIDDEHIFRLVQRVASKSGRHLDLSTPYFDAQLPDGSRIHAIIPPIAIDGIKVSLRKYGFSKLHIKGLVKGGSMTDQMADLLQMLVKARMNMAICGGTGSGKTTLMNALLASVSAGERMITIEDTPELEPWHHNTVRLLTRLPNPEGKGGVTQSDLMINALRMRPDRVILGELRGQEAFNLLHAMNTGQDGSMVTLHASGPEEVVSRLLNMILMARYAISAESVLQQIATALDIVIFVSRLVDGSRRVMSISQVKPGEGGRMIIEDIFKFDIEKISEEELRGQFRQVEFQTAQKIINKLTVSGLKDDFMRLLNLK